MTFATVVAVGLSSLAAATASSAGSAPTTTCATLAAGSHGSAVQTVQRAIGASPDGDFGPLTQAAVKKWQGVHKLKQTGSIDAPSWAALPAAVAVAACGQQVRGSGVASTCTTLAAGASGPAVAVLQTAVKTKADGVFGGQTQSALKAAQTKLKLKPTGIADASTWAALALTGTPVCNAPAAASKPSAPPADAKQQAAIAAQVVKLAAALPSTAGTTTNAVAAKALKVAQAQTGKPYQWGAQGPKAYDCSGLVIAAYRGAGITTPRVAADQYGTGLAVSLDKVQQGDLLFYASDVAKPATIYHVVMYVGAGKVIDAPYTGAFVGTRPLWTQNLLPVAWRPAGPLALPIKPGATGWSVSQLQQALVRGGAALTVDGANGPATTAAVRQWQQSHRLKVTGVVDVTTWLTLG